MSSEENVPEGLYFSEEHEWAKVEDSEVRVGITDHAQDELGDVVFVEFPEEGAKVEQCVSEGSEECELGAVESIKAVSSLYAPISGEVKEVNEELEENPELINEDPYGDGWICILSPSNLDDELDNLMDSEAYREFLESEE